MAWRPFDKLRFTSDPELEAVVCACLRFLAAGLEPDDAELIDRIDLQDEPRQLVAESLGIPIDSLDVRLREARRALRKRLVEMCLTCPEHGIMNCDCEASRRLELPQGS